jgi:hypothetical protein
VDQAEGRCRLIILLVSAIRSPRWLRPAGPFFVLGEISAQTHTASLLRHHEVGIGHGQLGTYRGELDAAAARISVCVVEELARVQFVDDAVVGVLRQPAQIRPEIARQDRAKLAGKGGEDRVVDLDRVVGDVEILDGVDVADP